MLHIIRIAAVGAILFGRVTKEIFGVRLLIASMGKVIAEFTLSLDGFVAGPDDDIRRLFGWYFSGDTDLPAANGMAFKVSRASAEHLRKDWSTIGAIVMGRRDFDVSGAWGGSSPMDGAPVFIVTHSPPQEWVKEGSPFKFVTEGVERAIQKARQAAGDKNVAISGSTFDHRAAMPEGRIAGRNTN